MAGDSHFRRTARRAIEIAIIFQRDAAGAALEQRGRLVDLGLGGAQVRCERPPEPGTRVRVRLVSPSAWDPLELEADVRWFDEASGVFGLAFEPLSPAEAGALSELLSAHDFAERAE